MERLNGKENLTFPPVDGIVDRVPVELSAKYPFPPKLKGNME